MANQPIISRREIYKLFEKYARSKDTRTMEQICSNDSGDFKLQVQQEFMRDYFVHPQSSNILLLYQALGSGKTCTSITMAEAWMEKHPEYTISVILPARLKTNFLDELISPCGGNKYISKEDFMKYNNAKTSEQVKKKIKEKFTKTINKKYEVMSFERFRKYIQDASNVKSFITEWTKNKVIIIDEIHNLINSDYDKENYAILKNENILNKVKNGFNTIMLRYLVSNAHESTRFVFLTATPIFDNISQLKDLVEILNYDKIRINELQESASLSNIIQYLRGKVSYFPGTSLTAYPSVGFVNHEVEMSEIQDITTFRVLENKKNAAQNSDSEAFLSKQRQIGLSCVPASKLNMDNIDDYAPKIKVLLEELNNKGKHVIFTNFVQLGIKSVVKILELNGWKDYLSTKKPPKFKTFAVWDGSLKDSNKTLIKSIVNDRKNMDGSIIKLIIGSPSIKEGVSLKHVQHMHLLDPVWNQSAKNQVEGRVIRFCSHVDIPENHPVLKRHVTVNLYKIVPRTSGGMVDKTCDQRIYDEIIPKKRKSVEAGESALKKVAIDYHLFKNMYKDVESPPPVLSTTHPYSSKIVLSQYESVKNKKNNNNMKKKTTCPKARRPPCAADYTEGTNKHGDPCCYKKKISKPKGAEAPSKCPKARRPPCALEYTLGENKHGNPCCYKKKKYQLLEPNP